MTSIYTETNFNPYSFIFFFGMDDEIGMEIWNSFVPSCELIYQIKELFEWQML